MIRHTICSLPSGAENADATELTKWVNADVMACIPPLLLFLGSQIGPSGGSSLLLCLPTSNASALSLHCT